MLDIKLEDLDENAYDFVKKKMNDYAKENSDDSNCGRGAKLIAYEAYDEGLVTLEEREELISSFINNQYFEREDNDVTSLVNLDIELESSLHEDGYELSNKEIYNKMKKELYYRYESGELSLDQREHLLAALRTKYLVEKI